MFPLSIQISVVLVHNLSVSITFNIAYWTLAYDQFFFLRSAGEVLGLYIGTVKNIAFTTSSTV